MKLHELTPPTAARHRRKRVGRGMGSGHGKTSGRGMKGQKAREQVRPGFEGGQTPLYRRVPKLRGISQGAMPIGRFRKEYAVINVGRLNSLEIEGPMTPEALLARRVIRKLGHGLRVLGEGEVTRPLVVRAQHFSEQARAKIEAAGGTAEVIA